MAGERIIEAIDISDRERALFQAYYEECSESAYPEKIPPPARNPVLASFDRSPEEHVLRTIENVRAAELFDALLVLPFGKVISMIEYLNEWALRVRHRLAILVPNQVVTLICIAGVEHRACVSHYVLLA